MTIFIYTALKQDGSNELVKGKVEAVDMRSARQAVRDLGLVATNIVQEDAVVTEQQKKSTQKHNGKMPKLGLTEQIDFTSTMQILSAAGIPIIESLMFIETDSANLRIR